MLALRVLGPLALALSPCLAVAAQHSATSAKSAIDGLEYVSIPSGSFEMGSLPTEGECDADGGPRHRVTLSRDFWLGRTEVTVQAFARFVAATTYVTDAERRGRGSVLGADGAWYERSGATWRTDGKNFERRIAANHNRPHAVEGKAANGFGLRDTLGNVFEWTADWFDESHYAQSPSRDPAGPASGNLRVLRGGSWNDDLRYVSVSFRGRAEPGHSDTSFGVRCARDGAPGSSDGLPTPSTTRRAR